jgi:hypothetical protein
MSEPKELAVFKQDTGGFAVKHGITITLYGYPRSGSARPPSSNEELIVAMCERIQYLDAQLAEATRKLEEASKDAESGVSLGEGMVSLQKDELLEFKSQRIFDLLQERDDLLLNTERYWWLRDQHWFESEATFRLSLSESQFANEYHDKLNAAIDQAIEQGKGGDDA